MRRFEGANRLGCAKLTAVKRVGRTLAIGTRQDVKGNRNPIGMEAVPVKTTIREVALAAGVGIGTISRVLNSS